jgi:hypothetical protein
MAEEIEAAISKNARGPAEARGDAGGVKQQPLADRIAADRYVEARRAARPTTSDLHYPLDTRLRRGGSITPLRERRRCGT